MKLILAVVIAAGVSAGGAYLVVSNKQSEEFDRQLTAKQLEWDNEREKLERELRRMRGQAPRIETVTTTVEVPVSDNPSAAQILSRLTQMKPGSSDADRYRTIREIIHQMESLVDLGPSALPAIRAFLTQNQDIPYERERQPEGEQGDGGRGPGGPGGPGAGPGGPGGRPDFGNFFSSGVRRTQDYYPYSLRMGLFDVVGKIGGPEAERVLTEALASTGRGVEVYHLDNLLGDKYKTYAISAAKDLLYNPMQMANPTRLDDLSKNYCYEILRKYNDASFLPSAKQLLVSADGQVDRSALRYITRVEGEQSMMALYQAFHNPRVTNTFDRVSLLNAAADFVGPNAQANAMLQEAIVTALNGEGRESFAPMMVLRQLDNGELQPNIIQSRLAVANQINLALQNSGNERAGFAQRMVQDVINNLQRKLDPNAAASGGERGDRGSRGGFSPGGDRGGRPR
jgi:hypothetical protein